MGGGQLGNDKNAYDFSDGGYGRRYGRGKHEIGLVPIQHYIVWIKETDTHFLHVCFVFEQFSGGYGGDSYGGGYGGYGRNVSISIFCVFVLFGL